MNGSALAVLLAVVAVAAMCLDQPEDHEAPRPVQTAPQTAAVDLSGIRAELRACRLRTDDLHLAMTVLAATHQGGGRARLPEPTAEGWPAWPVIGANVWH